MNIIERISPEALAFIRASIRDAEGREVLFVGRLSQDNLVERVSVASRGNDCAAPAIDAHMERGDVVIHNHPSGVLSPSMADISVASRLGNQGIGFYIIDSEAVSIQVVVEPVPGAWKRTLPVSELSDILGPDGKLSRTFPGYEVRESQIDMLERVAGAFNGNSVCIAEAGTGVGKSFAYLIPAMAWVMANDERVVISTATINLQHQLFEKDIPFVRKLLGCREKAVLVKGRGNYLCLNRLQEALDDVTLFEEDREGLATLGEWAKTTPTGCRSDLSFYPGESLWSSVCSEADICLGLRCAYRDDCFVLKARKEAAAAKILVVNHHLLFADLSLRLSGAGYEATAVLPPFQRIVFDEAHNLENSATSYFSESFNRLSLFKHLGRLFRRRRGRAGGLLIGLEKLFSDKSALEAVPRLTDLIREQADLCDSLSTGTLTRSYSFRFVNDAETAMTEPLLDALKELELRIASLAERLENLLSSLPEETRELMPVYESRLVLGKLQQIGACAGQFRNFTEKPEKVFWMEQKRTSLGDAFTNYIATPIDLSPLMAEAVFEPYETIVCTSATLSVNRSFSFWRSRVGLKGFSSRPVTEDVFPSPFQYKERVLLGIPTDAPEPDSPGYEEFLSRFVAETLLVSEGSGLILFTSYEMLKRVHAEVSPRLAGKGIVSLRQGDDERSRLLERFKSDISSVLFATDSFWEGVDAPGDALRVVVLCRLPFRVPSDPVVTARMEAIRNRNGNPFFELSLPEAVMKLKQGFGRLMRRHSDRGVVLIPDIRILRKNYGAYFLDSLPSTRRSVKGSGEVVRDIESFFYSG